MNFPNPDFDESKYDFIDGMYYSKGGGCRWSIEKQRFIHQETGLVSNQIGCPGVGAPHRAHLWQGLDQDFYCPGVTEMEYVFLGMKVGEKVHVIKSGETFIMDDPSM